MDTIYVTNHTFVYISKREQISHISPRKTPIFRAMLIFSVFNGSRRPAQALARGGATGRNGRRCPMGRNPLHDAVSGGGKLISGQKTDCLARAERHFGGGFGLRPGNCRF